MIVFGAYSTFFFATSANGLYYIRIQTNYRVVIEDEKLSVTLYTVFADSKPTVSAVATERARFLSLLAVLTIPTCLDLRQATLGATFVVGINVSGQLCHGKGDGFETRRAAKSGLLVGRLVEELLQTIEAEGV